MGKVEEEKLESISLSNKVLSSQHTMYKVLELTSDTLIVLDRDNYCVDLLLKTCNPILSAPENILGNNFINLLPSETAVLVEESICYTRETGQTSDSNYELLIGDCLYCFRLVIHKFDDNHLLCQYRDIDNNRTVVRQKITDLEKIRYELDRVMSVIYNVPRSVITVKSCGEVVFVNKSGLLGRNMIEGQDLSKYKIGDLISDFSLDDNWLKFKEEIANTTEGYRFSSRNQVLGQESLEMDSIALISEDWEGEDLIWIFQNNISDQVRYEEELLRFKKESEESEKVKMTFLSKMNHEIRTPLTAIIGLSMLIVDTAEEEMRHEYAKLITSNSDQLLRLVKDVVELSKLDSNLLSFESKPESLTELMKELYQNSKNLEEKAKLKLQLPAEDTIAFLDKGRVIQVLTNMIDNSHKVTGPTGSIEVSYQIQGNMIEMSIKDDGVGIPVSKQRDVFNRFYRISSNDIGSGLGLSICESIIDKMKGRIIVESEEGNGALFRVFIPLVENKVNN